MGEDIPSGAYTFHALSHREWEKEIKQRHWKEKWKEETSNGRENFVHLGGGVPYITVRSTNNKTES